MLRFRARWFVLAAVLLAGCTSAHEQTPAGGLEISVESDLTIPKDIDRIELEVTQAGRTLLHVDPVTSAGGLLLPAEFYVAGSGDSTPVTVHGVAYKDGAPRIERSAVTQIPKTRTALLELPLNYLCDDTAEADGSSSCGGGQTCKQGTCATSGVAESDLPDGTTNVDASGATTDTARCFDVQACFAGAATFPLDDATCSVPTPPLADPARLNVALQFPAGSAGVCNDKACWVVLDAGTGGWTLDGSRLELPAGVCSGSRASRAFAVAVTSACQTKASDTLACGPWSSAQTPVETPMQAPATAVSGACDGEGSRVCGNCGTETRSCTDGVWSDWTACQGEGECAVGTSQSCGTSGSQSCGADCHFTACANQTCGGASTRACGNCGTARRTCDNGSWSDFGSCDGEGECAPEDTRSCQGNGTQSCGGDCRFGACVAAATCSGASSRGCGNCGTQTRSCDDGTWSAWSSCESEGECAAGDTHVCDSGGVASCGGDCHYQACEHIACSGASSQSCGDCGTRTRTCDDTTGQWSAWSTCSNEGSCSAGASEACGGQGTHLCSDQCQWGSCACPNGLTLCNGTCVDPKTDAGNCGACNKTCGVACVNGSCTCDGTASEPCGNCGTHARTCANGVWSAWSACTNTGNCVPGSSMPCGSNDASTCSNTCQWGACQCGAGYATCGSGCFDLARDSAHCGNCGTACPSGGSCQNGVCACAAGSHVCSGACVSNSLLTSCGTTACSSCAAPSNGSATCDGTLCGTACPNGLTLCGSACVNLTSDSSHCGSCAGTCSGGHTCQGGTCSCPAGTRNCNGTCASVCTPTATCNDPTSGLHWATTGGAVVTYAAAADICASFGGSWRLPTQTELTKWPWTSAGHLCGLSTSVDTRASGAYVNNVWSSTPYTGTVGSGPTCSVYYNQASIANGLLDGVCCPDIACGQTLCVE